METELETISIEDEVDKIYFSEVEQSLVSILGRWSDTSSVTPIADKWKKEIWYYNLEMLIFHQKNSL